MCNNIIWKDNKNNDYKNYIIEREERYMKEEKDKESRLLNTAFKLFTEKGIKDTSIQEIVDNANVAKGTFYLYFKDILISRKSSKLFNEALKELRKNYIANLSDQVIFIINYVIDELSKTPTLLKFISKNLSWGIYNKNIKKIYEENNEDSVYQLFLKGVEDNHIDIKNPEVTLYMIIELVSSTCVNSILYNDPLPIKEFKPYLYETIRKMIEAK